MKRDDVLRKVKALLKLGDSDNPNESAAAVAKAHALMERHNLEMSMLGGEEESIEKAEEALEKNAARWWVRGLAKAIAVANGCDIVLVGTRRIEIFGKPENIEDAQTVYQHCLLEIDLLAIRHKGRGSRWLNSFRHGCVIAIQEAIEHEKRLVREEMRSAVSGSALIVLDDAISKRDAESARAKDFIKEKMELGTKERPKSDHDPDGLFAGLQEGSAVYGKRNPVKSIAGDPA